MVPVGAVVLGEAEVVVDVAGGAIDKGRIAPYMAESAPDWLAGAVAREAVMAWAAEGESVAVLRATAPDSVGAADDAWAGGLTVGTAVVDGAEADANVTNPPASASPGWAAAVVTKDKAAESRPPAITSDTRDKGRADRVGSGVRDGAALPDVLLGTETEGCSWRLPAPACTRMVVGAVADRPGTSDDTAARPSRASDRGRN